MCALSQHFGRDTLHTVIHVYISFTLLYISYMYMYAVVQRLRPDTVHIVIHVYVGFTLQHTATNHSAIHCNTLQHTTAHDTLHRTASWDTQVIFIGHFLQKGPIISGSFAGNDLWRHPVLYSAHYSLHIYVGYCTSQTATHCNTLQHTATHYSTRHAALDSVMWHTATHCNTLQHATVYCSIQ